ncbi:TIGR03085 family metal-binding protein [Corynebacterium uterequi]|uniref:Putative TIGR03085 family protein n=1 Tax=Corynebacterium uterequi TaxID=1072256 RepID=A0A0G3HJL3_9CORY|nr:TIGR03085 family metal-binding protein [Corynebacterium uterequi]AKK11312.1 putative TIGR03085 family protein [Corynebacterium uterequi]
MSFSAAERRHLADLMLKVGPDAPTLCEGWTTRDLAAHLYVRENDFFSAAGMFVERLAERLDKAMDEQRRRDFTELVDDWAAGPAGLWKVLDSKANAVEHFVHYEDVARGAGEIAPRDLSLAAEKELLAGLKRLAPMLMKGSSKPVILTPEGHEPITVGGKRGVAVKGDDVVRVAGPVGEIVLWVFGRDAVKVTVTGDTTGVVRG